ncbi:hypothetical protein D9M71_643720 [compost metagenome]
MPSGLFDLEYLSRVDLTLNDIVDVSEDLFDVPVTRAVDFDFRGNPLSPESDSRISQYLNSAGLDLKVSIRWDGLSEVEEGDDDFGGASTDSALGSDEENDEP